MGHNIEVPHLNDKRSKRQDAVDIFNRHLSTDELAVRVHHANTLIAMYTAQRERNRRIIDEASDDARTCETMIHELSADVATLNTLIKARRS